MYGIHMPTTYLNIRRIISLVRVEEGSVDIVDMSILIIKDPCHHEAFEQSP